LLEAPKHKTLLAEQLVKQFKIKIQEDPALQMDAEGREWQRSGCEKKRG